MKLIMLFFSTVLNFYVLSFTELMFPFFAIHVHVYTNVDEPQILTDDKFVGTHVELCHVDKCSLCEGSPNSWSRWMMFNCGDKKGDWLYIYNPNFYTIFCEVYIRGRRELINID